MRGEDGSRGILQRAASRVYRAGLLLLPREFRRTCAPGMAELFAERSAAEGRRGAAALGRWWLRAILDLGLTAAREWRAALVAGKSESGDDSRAPWRGDGEGRMGRMMDVARQELRQAFRSLARAPRLVAAVVVVLALGVGVNAAMFELVDRLLLRPPPFLSAPESVNRVYVDRRVRDRRIQDGAFSYAFVRDAEVLADHGITVTGVFGTSLFVSVDASVPQPRTVRAVTGPFFGLFDLRPEMGRFLVPADDRPEATPVVVLSHGFWTRELGADPNVVGRTLSMGRRSYEVVGVAPEGFHGEALHDQAGWVALAAVGEEVAGPEYLTRPFTTWVELLVQREGVSMEVAEERLTGVLTAHWEEANPDFVTRAEPRIVLAPLLADRGPNPSDASRVGVWLLAMSVVVLLVAGVNVSILLLGRAVARTRDAAVRSAMGVSRTRLAAGPLVESLLLAAGAALLSVPVAQVLAAWAGRLLLSDSVVTPHLTVRSFVVGGVAVLAMALTTSAAPVAHLLNGSWRGRLGVGSRGGGMDGGQSRAQSLLVGTQAALSAVLIVAAGLFLRSLHEVRTLELGYQPERVLLTVPVFRSPGGVSTEEGDELMRRLRARLEGEAAVESTALTATVPFYRNSYDPVFLEDGSRAPEAHRYATHAVSGDYFDTFGTRILEGRGIESTDDEDSEPVAVVSRAMADAVWPGGSALGRCLRLGADTMPCSRVVGVAADIRRGDLADDATMQFYASWPQYFYGMPRVLAVRTRGPARARVEEIRHALQEAAGDAAYIRVEPFLDRVEAQSRTWRLGASAFGAFGTLALLLATFGLFSVVAWDVSRRRWEFGVRAALGAAAGHLVREVAGRGVRPALLGLAVGLVAAWTLGGALEAVLFRTSTRDPLAFLGTGLLLAGSALAATLLPGVRAARTDPVEALRGD